VRKPLHRREKSLENLISVGFQPAGIVPLELAQKRVVWVPPWINAAYLMSGGEAQNQYMTEKYWLGI
jgi:hypothetical protein